jgi:hypothetical protein
LNDPTATPIHKFANESLESPTGTFQNSLSTIIPWKDKLVNFMSYVKYQKDKQTLTVSPGNYMENFGFSNFDKIRQYAISKTLEVNHSASVGFSYRKWTFTPEFGLNMNFNNLKSAITGEVNNNNYYLGTDRQNDMDWNEVMPYTQVGVNFKSQNFNLNLTLPMNFYGITYKDNIRQNYLDKSKTVFEPNLFANLDFASFFKIWAFANQSYDFGNFGFLYGGNMLTSPTNLQKRFSNNIEMPEYLSRMIGSRLEYRNPLNNLFFNVRYNYSTNKRNLIESYTTNGFVSQLELQSRRTQSEPRQKVQKLANIFQNSKPIYL